MSESDSSSTANVDGTVLQDQILACDEIIEDIIDSHRGSSGSVDEEDIIGDVYEFYGQVREFSVKSFENRFQTSALYTALKTMLRTIGKECGYEHRMKYERAGRTEVADSVDNIVYWFKLYAGGVLERQPEITYEWAVPHFKEHRDLTVSHPTEIESLRDRPDPTLVSSVVPLWHVLEDILRLWRKILDMDSEDRTHREQILKGEREPENSLNRDLFGFIQKLEHRQDRTDIGFITGFQNGEDGKSSRFEVGDPDFFPSVGDVVQFSAEQRERRDGKEFNALTVTSMSLVE